MRDIELLPIGDNAYARPQAGGLPAVVTATDPSFTDTKAYGRPSVGGEFGPVHSPLLSAPADGGEVLLATDTTIIVTPPVVPTPPSTLAGRSANNTSFLNLYPWKKTPPQGLDQNNPNPPPAMEDPPPPPAPSGITVTGNTLVGNQGTVVLSGPASRHAVIRLTYGINGNPNQILDINVLVGDTGSQLAARVRAAIDAVFGLDASGTGGTVNVVGLGGLLTYFNISVV